MKPVTWVCLCVLSVIGSVSLVAANFIDSQEHIELPDIEYLQVAKSKNIHVREKRKILFFDIHPSKKWPTTINYMFSSKLTIEQQNSILEVLRNDFERNTCLKFNEIFSKNESKEQFIHFKDHSDNDVSSCKAYIGKENDTRTFHGQPIYFGYTCLLFRGQIVHMIASTLGMFNELQRPDRDQYVDIFFNNIAPEGISNFVKQDFSGVETHGVPYDYASALHFRSKAWLAQGNHGYTVLPKDRSLTHLLGQLSEISFYDVQVLNHAYCSKACPVKKECYNGGYQDPKDCSACRCPDGYGGHNCNNMRPGSSRCTPHSGKIDVTETEKCVSSPGYEQQSSYTQGDHCSWMLEAPPGKYIDMWFKEVLFGLPHLETDVDVCVHWVEIKYKGLNTTRGARYCNKDNKLFNPQMPVKTKFLTSEASRVLVLFKAPRAHLTKSYNSEILTGFKLCFKISSYVPTTTVKYTGNDKSRVEPVTEKESGSKNMIIWIVAVVGVLLIVIIVCGVIIIVLLYRRKRKQPETVVVANGMNNPGYAEHAFPVVSFHNPDLDKKMELFGAMGASMGALPPKYDDIPDEAPPYAISGSPYAISGEYVKDQIDPGQSFTTEGRSAPNHYGSYEVPFNNSVAVADRPSPALPDDDAEDPVYQNAPKSNVNNLNRIGRK